MLHRLRWYIALAVTAILSSGLVAIADYAVTLGSGTNFGSKVIGGVHFASQLVCDATTANQCAAVSAGGALTIAGAVTNAGTFAVQAAAGTNAVGLAASNPSAPFAMQMMVSDNTLLQRVLAPIILGDAVNGNNMVSVGGWIWNGTTWDRMPGTAAAGVKAVVTNSGTFAVQSASTLAAETTKVIGTVNLANVTGTALGTPADYGSTPTGKALSANVFVTNSNANGPATPANSSPVVNANQYSNYETVAASATAQALGATGATGDYLSHCVATPGTTSPGVVTILDNSTAIVSFAGGASSTSNLIPFAIPIGAFSVSGAWKITTGTNITVVCFGKFT